MTNIQLIRESRRVALHVSHAGCTEHDLPIQYPMSSLSSSAVLSPQAAVTLVVGQAESDVVCGSFNDFVQQSGAWPSNQHIALKKLWDLSVANSADYGGVASAWTQSDILDINTLPFPRRVSVATSACSAQRTNHMTNLAWTTDLASLEEATDEERRCNGSTRALAEALEMGPLFCAIGERMDARAASPTSVIAVTNESVVEINCDASEFRPFDTRLDTSGAKLPDGLPLDLIGRGETDTERAARNAAAWADEEERVAGARAKLVAEEAASRERWAAYASSPYWTVVRDDVGELPLKKLRNSRKAGRMQRRMATSRGRYLAHLELKDGAKKSDPTDHVAHFKRFCANMVLNVSELAAMETGDPAGAFAAIAEERAALTAQYRDRCEGEASADLTPAFAEVTPAEMLKMKTFAASIFKNTQRSALEQRGIKNAAVPQAECDAAAAVFARFAAAGAANHRRMRELCAVDTPPLTRAEVVAKMRAFHVELDAQIAERARLRAADDLPIKVGSTPARSAWEIALATTPLSSAPATFSAFHRSAASTPKPRGCGRIVTKRVPLQFVDLFDASITFAAVAATVAKKYGWTERAVAVDSDPMVRLRSLPCPGAAAHFLDMTLEIGQRFLDACRSWAQSRGESRPGLFRERTEAQRARVELIRVVWRKETAPRLRHGFLIPDSSQFDVRRPLSRAASQALSQVEWQGLSQADWASTAASRAASHESAQVTVDIAVPEVVTVDTAREHLAEVGITTQSSSEFLNALGLAQYVETFDAEGYEELANLEGMTVEDLKDELGMKTGHAKKLMRCYTEVFCFK